MGTSTGKTAVVTGSTSGIGLAMRAPSPARRQYRYQRLWRAADIEKERSGIETDFRVKAVYSPADMTKPAEIAEMVALGEKTFGSVDILVNNAGIQFVSPIEDSRSRNGSRSSRSICRRHFTASAPPCPA